MLKNMRMVSVSVPLLPYIRMGSCVAHNRYLKRPTHHPPNADLVDQLLQEGNVVDRLSD